MVWVDKVSLLLRLLLVVSLVGSPTKAENHGHGLLPRYCSKGKTLSKAMFPTEFIWGTATGAFQVEGGVTEGCRGPSLWDTFTHKYPEKCQYSNADVAVDFYHRYKEDIQLMKDLNTNAFRFSIAWPRIFPHGRMSKGVSIEGVQFYHDLIDELLRNNITPLVTVFHWDTPQDLEDEYGGFLSRKIVKDFTEYANFTFHEYGDKVKHWVTLNEPLSYSRGGYEIGRLAPGHCSSYIPHFGPNCVGGRSGFEAYQVTHNLLLSHADAVEAFRKCKKCAGGKIGIAHSPSWFEPFDEKTTQDTIKRALDFDLGWHLHPTTYGDYPQSMKDNVGFRLPNFTDVEKAKLRNSADFVGINYYTSQFAKNNPNQDFKYPSWQSDSQVDWSSQNVNKMEIGSKPTHAIMDVYASGLRKILKYVKEEYGDPEIMILENGYGETLEDDDNVKYGTNDTNRKYYLERHLSSLHEAICLDKVHVTGYFVWSMMDNFEWVSGYKSRYGLYYIDYNNNLTRYRKLSGKWYSDFLNPRLLTSKISKEEL